MKKSNLVVALAGLSTVLLTGCANLEWVEPKIYDPPAGQIEVEKLGIDGTVDLLPPGTSAIVISHQLTNSGLRSVPAGYQITETIVQWVFQRRPASVGWVAGDPATHTVATLAQAGPALAPGETATITFGPFPVNDCGLYSETLTADTTGIVTESSRGDNDDEHLFFVPSAQRINIAVAPASTGISHEVGRAGTNTFTITSAGGTPPNQWMYTGFSFIATEGSTANTVPAPAPGVPVGPGPQIIQMFVNTVEHDIPDLGFSPTIKGKVTAIATDGCVIAQKAAEVFVEHE